MYLRLTPILVLLALLISACQKEFPKLDKGTDSQKQVIETAWKEIEKAQQEGLQIQLQALKGIPANAVELPAGSTDGLAAAIAEAGKGGTVLVKAGEHLESGTVLITQQVNIIGEQGAVIISGTQPLESIGYLQAALHIKDATGVMVYGLKMQADSDFGGTAILIQDAPKSSISHNSITNFGFGIVNQGGDYSYISNNTIVGSSAWQSDFNLNVHGIVNINGDRVRIFNNVTTNNIFGIWACDEKGMAFGNTMNENFIGLILCKVPTRFPLPDGSIVGSENSGQDWVALQNTANGNFHVGIIVIDGANSNLLIMNKAANNTDDNIELAGESQRFGFITPTSFENKVIGAPGVSIKDCGINNSIHGGEMVDTALHPCY